MPTLNKEVIEAAIAGFEVKKQNIEQQIAELRAMLERKPAGAAPSTRGRSGRKLSPEAIERIREGQKRRWASARSASSPSSRPKRKISAAGRKAIAAAQKKRWAEKKKLSAAGD
jgi:PP-loop superfamily ATP-utilizing enzyme